MAAATGPALYPGANTFPNTNVYPGQGDLPLHRVMVSHSDYAASPPVWTDYSSRGRNITVSRGRNSELDNFDAGSATVVLDNRDRTLDPFVNATVRPMNRVWIYAEFSGVREDIFRGYAEAWEASWDRSGIVDAVATLRATDEFKVLNLVNVPDSGTPPNSGGTAAAIVGDVLDAVANHAPRNLLVNEYAVTGYTYAGQAALSDIGAIALSGAVSPALFVGRDGSIQLVARGSTPLATFGDGGGAELPYFDCQLDYSDAFLFNTWTVTGTSSTSATAADATSVGQFGKRQNSRAVLWDAVTGGFGATLAGSLVANYKNPFQRVASLKPNMANIDVCQQTLARELIDRIRLLRTPPGGGSRIDEQLFIQRIDYAATPGVPPDVQLGVSPL